MDSFQNKYRILSARLANRDYGSRGLYFVTICTQHREYYFGDIAEKPAHVAAPYFGSQYFAVLLLPYTLHFISRKQKRRKVWRRYKSAT